MVVPCMAGDTGGFSDSVGQINISSYADVASENRVFGMTFQAASNQSSAGYCGGNLCGSLVGHSGSTYATSAGGTFGLSFGGGTNIGRQTGSAFAGFRSMTAGW